MPLFDDDLSALIALHALPGIGANTLNHLLIHFGSASAVIAALGPLAKDVSIPTRARQSIASLNSDWHSVAQRAVDRSLNWAAQNDNHILPRWDPLYPRLLKETVGYPPLLFVQGSLACLSLPQLAVVGSRNASPQALCTARTFAQELADGGIGITSGLALGVDGAAHEGALAGAAQTIAVLGSGIDRIYPQRHRDLATRVSQHGALISEFPIGTTPSRELFPRRNRLISGLSLGVLIVEAALKSGSLITARFALEQGREVFAVPGSIHNPNAAGCLQLIREGAVLVRCCEDIVEELPLYYESPNSGHCEQPLLQGLQAKIWQAIGDEFTPFDAIARYTGAAIGELRESLLTLELEGYIRNDSRGYMRINSAA